MKKFLLAGWLTLQIAACASPARQTEQLLSGPPGVPPAHVLTGIPLIKHEAGYCGPAALTIAMQAAGKEVTAADLAAQVITPGGAGSLQMDMISAVRRNGMMAVAVENLNQLVEEVASGRPVLVFQNLGLSWLPRWHYADVVGYDLPRQEIIMHSGNEAYRREPLRYFERSWGLADFWALVIIKPGEVAQSADELAHLKAALGLEQAKMLSEAAFAYDGILRRWPESLGALVGRANIAYQKTEYQTAVNLLRVASKAHPDSIIARHNLAVAEQAVLK